MERKFHGEATESDEFDVITPDTTAQILGASPVQVKVIDSWAWVVWVHIEGRRPRFMSYQAFTELFNKRGNRATKGKANGLDRSVIKRHLQGCLFTQSRT